MKSSLHIWESPSAGCFCVPTSLKLALSDGLIGASVPKHNYYNSHAMNC
ncbi:hypothetical protein NEISUBOT_04470 [Neisseria subflava NJ9703]|uniref:Uncharacterized protein n=1 Tax=Neisseria subflava NJ9703 TaxID=546268 RepID=A0A9W5IQW9_NEISU|nr:hypothetical protein NEISUBOT_04470 [Neisseria subflava NJ9703]